MKTRSRKERKKGKKRRMRDRGGKKTTTFACAASPPATPPPLVSLPTSTLLFKPPGSLLSSSPSPKRKHLAEPPGLPLALEEGEDVVLAHGALHVTDDGAGGVVEELNANLQIISNLILLSTVMRLARQVIWSQGVHHEFDARRYDHPGMVNRIKENQI